MTNRKFVWYNTWYLLSGEIKILQKHSQGQHRLKRTSALPSGAPSDLTLCEDDNKLPRRVQESTSQGNDFSFRGELMGTEVPKETGPIRAE